LRKTIIAFDIDGTLAGFGGIISEETIKRLLYHTHVGIVSTRPDAYEIAIKLGLKFVEIGKSEALYNLAKAYPDALGRVYIADTKLDEEEARKVGWNFVYVNNIKLNLASGEDIRYGWINTDIRQIRGIDICMDHEKYPIPFEDGIISEILLKDFLEHISWRKTEWFLNECYRVLKPGGKIYIQCPDLEAIAKKVILDPDFKFGELSGYKAISFWTYGRQDDWGGVHKAGFTIPTLKRLLEEVIGFKVEKIKNDGGTNIICTVIKP